MNRATIERDLIRDFTRQGRIAEVTANTATYRRALLDAYAAAGVATDDEREALTGFRADDFRAARRRTIKAVRDQFAADPDRQRDTDGPKENRAILDALKQAGVSTRRDERTYAARPGGIGGGIGGGVMGRWFADSMLISGFRAASHGGRDAGKAVGEVATGLSRGVTSAASGFVAAGTQALALFLSPFGKSGLAIGQIGGAFGQALVSAVGAGGALAGAGIKIAGGLVGGIAAGVANLIPTALGAALGSVVPGVGTLAGAAAGAGLGGALAGLVGNVLGGLGGAVGQLFASLGQSVGALGRSIGQALSSVQGVLADLVRTGTAFGTAALGIARGGGLSVGASSQYAALGGVLTGRPDAFAGLFSNFGTMSPYLASRARAFGVPGVNPNDPSSLIGGAYDRYQSLGGGPMGAVQRQILLQGLFPGASDQVGGLFSMGGGMVRSVLSTMRKTAMSPQETVADARLGMSLDVVSAQITRIKTKFLSDLMPAISAGLNLFTQWFGKNESKILAGLEGVGRWLVVSLPGVVKQGVDAFLGLGKALLGVLPTIGAIGSGILSMLGGVLGAVKGAAGFIGSGLSKLTGGDPLSRGLLAFGKAPNPITAQMALGVQKPLTDAYLNGTAALGRAQGGFNRFYGGLGLGTEADRARQYDQYIRAAHGHGGQRVQVEIVQRPNEKALYEYEARILHKNAQQQVWALQDAGS